VILQNEPVFPHQSLQPQTLKEEEEEAEGGKKAIVCSSCLECTVLRWVSSIDSRPADNEIICSYRL